MALNDYVLQRHLLDLANRVKKVTDGIDERVTAFEEKDIHYNTTAYWNEQKNLIPHEGAIVIYSDYSKVDDIDIPNFKVGDGKAYLIDLPFANNDLRATIAEHIANDERHLTSEDRTKLSNSVTVNVQQKPDGDYNLIFV